ncbi:phytoene desaturase family protein [Streptomyces sp. NPDC060194]|uniref:phytoene desaturase family protein n=1 Tax=Streptomyces sp. NPDC060194 TaxID=3347069 RepID=UPI00365B61C8
MARIAVIGAGTGAMATAARLAVAGHRVVVFERTETYGGSLGRFERDGFVFDTGPGLLGVPAVYRDLFVKTGRKPLEECVDLTQVDPSSAHVFSDGTRVALPNASRAGVVSALEEALGAGAGERWGEFLVRAREAWDRTRRPLLEEPLWSDWKVLAEREPYPALRRRRLLRTRQAATLAEIGALELGDPRLAALLSGFALEHGLDPRHAPASAAVLPYMEHAFGTWYVRGGLRELARAVYERCLERRVEFVFGARVTGVVEKDGRAAGVELADGRVEEADHVVSSASPDDLPLPGGAAVADAPAERHGLPGRFTVLLALRGPRPEGTAHKTVVHAPDSAVEAAVVFGSQATPAERPTLTVLRPDDPATRPDADHEAVTLTATVAPRGPVDWADPATASRYADTLAEVAEAAVPGLRERVLWREVLTPADTAPVRPPALAAAAGAYLYPPNTTGLPGLFRAGGWSHPGGGLAHAGMSGALVAGLIVEGPGFRGSR